MINRFLAKLKLALEDPLQEEEYIELRLPLIKEIFKYLFGCLTMFFIPLTVRYYIKDLYPQTYIGITAFVISTIVFILRNKLSKQMKLLSILSVSFVLSIGFWNVNFLLTMPGNKEAFYMGYTFALMQKMIDFRATRFWIVLSFNILFTILKFCLIRINNPDLIIITLCLEVFPILLSFKCEQTDRVFFDSLCKSKNQLLKFKQLLTEYLPNQIAIFAQDFSKLYFVNNSFKKSFECKDIIQAKNSLDGFVLDSQDYEKNKELLSLISGSKNHKDNDDEPLTLLNFMKLLITNKSLIRDLEDISFQIVGQSVKTKHERLKEQHCNFFSNPLASHEKDFMVLRRLSQENLAKKEVSRKDKDDYQEITALTGPKNILDTGDTDTHTRSREEKIDQEQEPKKRVFKVKIFALTWDNNEAIALVLDDVTHERTIMELKIAAKNKDLVIATVSHELRTPINGTLGLLEIMKKIVNQNEVMSYLTACKSNCRLLLNLVNSILDLSQIENKKLRLMYSKVHIGDLLSEIKTLFDHYCQIKRLYLNIEVDPHARRTIITDHIRLSQVIINLLGNAFKFTFKGGITLSINIDSESPYRLRFCIKDTGIGIKKENQDKLSNCSGD